MYPNLHISDLPHNERHTEFRNYDNESLIQKSHNFVGTILDMILDWNRLFALDIRPTNGDNVAIVDLAWHKYQQKFSIATTNGVIYMYDLNNNAWSTSPLYHDFQKNIKSITWKPLAANILAVGCENGYCIWKYKNMGHEDVMLDIEMKFHKYPGLAPVSSLSWSPDGHFLATASYNFGYIVIWDIHHGTNYSLPQYLGRVSCLEWSPDGRFLFASSSSSPKFRIWETKSWTSQKWTQFEDSCQAACWSSSGTFLAFAVNDKIHFLEMPEISENLEARYCAKEDLTEYQYVHNENDGDIDHEIPPQIMCGTIKDMAWDKTGRRLVVSFKNNPLLALYQTSIGDPLKITPMGFIRGPPNATTAETISFCTHFPRGALLSVGWNTGKISFFPLYVAV
eukprot:TRINITY_DN3440_c0_g1_i3.p1 TRINITY_DN3440_c0_g1~~TRINITY_DN3440_c0_g1_i3.p1  ORF type:complete len:395 (-),score=76.93 TRINITY_DN3440_c0_g1_i3:79-1263(-)